MKKLMIIILFAMTPFMPIEAQSRNDAIRLVVPFGPGGGTDILTRLVAPHVSEIIGQQIVVENRGGAGSQVGTQSVARAAPDGNTLVMVDTAFTTNPNLYRNLPYDSERDFEPVALLASAPVILVVNPAMPAQNLADLIALGKKGSLQSASAGPGSATSLGTDLFASVAGIKIEQIPYKGVGPAIIDVLGGTVPMMITGISSARQHVESGKLRAIAVSGDVRPAALPDVPTFSEAGLAGVEAHSYWGLLAPAGTPKATIDRLSSAFADAIRQPAISSRLQELGFNPIGGSAEVFRMNIHTETQRWAKVIQESGIEMQN